ncbi:MAG: DNA-binding protein [Lachnospiraceae bacterium]
MEERLELSLLYDFYGALLKENQQRMFEASILEDYNFSEIAQDEGITRQGVYDTVKRAVKQLEMYEEKLGLVARFKEQKEMAGKLRDKLEGMKSSDSSMEWEEIFRLLEKMEEG